MQKILRIQNRGEKAFTQNIPVEDDRKRSLVEDITKKYTNIKLRRISSPDKPAAIHTQKPPSKISPEKPPSTVQKPPNCLNLLSPKSTKVVIVEQSTNRQKTRDSGSSEVKRSFMCISCSEKFQKFSDLEIHLRHCKITTTKQFKCFCGNVLASKKALSDHISLKHQQNKQIFLPSPNHRHTKVNSKLK